jgi:hypothetical protein
MISACEVASKGLNLFDYDTRATINGFIHEVASGHATAKKGRSVGPIHGSTTIIADYEDGISRLFLADVSVTTGPFTKYFNTSSTNFMCDLNYIEGTVLVIATSYFGPWNIEIHITT